MRENILYDPIRKQHVAATPEELVRQATIQRLVKMGYPQPLIAVEKKLAEICFDATSKLPQRRIDIVCFSNKNHRPLLMIECKASKITQKALLQVMGYNRLVKAPCIAVCSKDQLMMAYWDSLKKDYVFFENFLDYPTLVDAV